MASLLVFNTHGAVFSIMVDNRLLFCLKLFLKLEIRKRTHNLLLR